MGSIAREKVLLPLLLLTLTACSTRLPAEGVEAFSRHNYRRAIDVFRKDAQKQDKNTALFQLALLSSAMTAGDYYDAEPAAKTALDIMWSYEGQGKGVASLVSAEAIKIFKGEPFEKSMAAVYAGIIFYNRGEYDNARAAFQKATMAIQQKQASHSEDFPLAYFLLAKAFLKLGDTDNAQVALDRAKKGLPGNPFFSIEALGKSNALFVLEMGWAPRKTRSGPGDSLVEWKRGTYPERRAAVRIDDRPIGSAELAGDLTQQAKTKGWTGKDSVQVTKGVTRDAAAVTALIAADAAARGNRTAGWVALGAGLFALANQSQADVRQWEILPDLIGVLPAQMTPGLHTIELQFFDPSGNALSDYGQVWYQIPFGKGDDRIFLFRSGKYKAKYAG